MLRVLALLALAVPLGFAATSCKSSDQDHTAEMKLCEHCGMENGSTKCCDPAMARCQECGMIAGAPGCCAH